MFTHLHVHTEFSLLDGMCRIPDLVKRVKELGMDALAITDHGAMYGAIKFYQECKKQGIKPIIGCEIYVSAGSRLSRTAADKSSYHLVLLAKNKTGYQNLLKLVSHANIEGYYYKPRIDKELLGLYAAGLVGMSACPSGEVPRLLLENRFEEAKEAARWYKDTLEDFYFEIQRHPMPELEKINPVLIDLGRELGIPIVATGDLHYVNKEDARVHDLLLCVGTNTTVNEVNRMKMPGEFFYLRSPEEMAELYADIPEALENSARIAAGCNLELEFGRLHLPHITIPDGQTPHGYLSRLCREGLPRYYPQASKEVTDRLDYELEVIKKTEFAEYFLVVLDIMRFVKEQGIYYGVRGSAAASMVLYTLGITPIDPLAHTLVFERFLNIERKEMPDIDMDFEDERRDEVIQYVSAKYGAEHVAQIITFGTLGARAALRDIGRALGIAYAEVDRVARLVPFAPGMTLERALEENSELRDVYAKDQRIKDLINTARSVEGISRHASTHAAGVVISKEPLNLHTPLQRLNRESGTDLVMTQYPMEDIAHIGLLKMDFLGLANLSVLNRACQEIKKSRGTGIDFSRIPFDDPKTFDLLSSGDTSGVFQLEGSGMRRYIKELKPSVFSDIAAMVALYRPGPMEQIPRFIRAKHGLEPITYPHPALENILKETYGVIVYQEQVLFIAQAFAGYSLGQADILRKAMGKKIAEVMQKQRAGFISGAVKKGFTGDMAATIFDLIEPFAGYAFNKAHATSYALIAYQTAYLKANFPAEYMTAYLQAFFSVADKVSSAVGESRRLGIEVSPPSVNYSQANFSIEKDPAGKGGILYGLSAIKNVGVAVIEPLIRERESGGVFKSVEDFCRRVDLGALNRRVLESLIKAGALDELGDRGTLLHNVGRLIALSTRERKLKETGQATIFDLFGDASALPMPALELEHVEISSRDRLTWEKELLSTYLSAHPFTPYAARAASETTTLCGELSEELDGQNITLAGMVASMRSSTTRDGNAFVSVELEDLNGRTEVTAWPRLFAVTKELWQEGNIILVEGKVVVRGDRVNIHADAVYEYPPENGAQIPSLVTKPVYKKPPPASSASEKTISVPVKSGTTLAPAAAGRLFVTIKQTDNEQADSVLFNGVVDTLSASPGATKVTVVIDSGEKLFRMRLKEISVSFNDGLRDKLAEKVGLEAVRFEGGAA